MRLSFLASLLVSVSAATVVLPAAHAAPGEAEAVIASCGTPSSDTYSKSEVTGLPMRTLVYGDTRMNFEPADASATNASWQFTAGWRGHLPETANEVAKHIPCFSQGLQSAQGAASGQALAADPSIAFQGQQASQGQRAPFGIANLWIILFLAGVIAIFAVAIPRRRTMVTGPSREARPYRRPSLAVARTRRRPFKTVVPSRS